MQVYMAGPLFTPYERRFIAECAAVLRAAGIQCFVPHEHELAIEDIAAKTIFETDYRGLSESNAVVALLDGPMVDDGTACEIGIFYGLMRTDPTKKGVLGLLTDLRSNRRTNIPEGKGINFFVLGCIQDVGDVYDSIDECLPVLLRWKAELEA